MTARTELAKKSVYSLPYHNSHLSFELEAQRVKVIQPPVEKANGDEASIVKAAMQNPIGTTTLNQLAKGKKRVTIISSDHTRAMPSQITMPILLEEIRRGNPDAEISILIATGLHRATTPLELLQKFGKQIVENEHIYVSDASREQDFVSLGMLPSGSPLEVHRLAVDCDLLVTEGFIEPHFFAGFSGGRKSILPGVCSSATISANHCFQAIANEHSVIGNLDSNPIHIDMLEAARRVQTDFIMNVTLDSNKKITAAFAGDLEMAHAAGVAYVRKHSACLPELGDIIITSNGGYPLDQNLYQTPKALSTAMICAKQNAVLILCAACTDGIGGEFFGELMLNGTPETTLKKLERLEKSQTIPEQWNAQVFLQIMQKHPVILVSELDPNVVRQIGLIPAATAQEAIDYAYATTGRDADIVIIPDGPTTLITQEKE